MMIASSRFSVLTVTCLVTLCASVWTVYGQEPSHYRLPHTTTPLHYTLALEVDPAPSSSYFRGRVSIFSLVRSTTSSVVLHQDGLNITSISVTCQGEEEEDTRECYSSHHVAEDDTNFLTIHLTEASQAFEYLYIDISYTGPYYTPQAGLFRDFYRDEQTNIRYLLATQMEPINARLMFPCYDEPTYRATFEIHVTCPSEYHALSNSPLDSVLSLPGAKETLYKFKVTPPMATYLVAVVVSDFAYSSNTEGTVPPSYPKEFRSYARPEAKELLGYSIDVGQKLLTILEDYVDFKYDMEKMDNIALPSFGGAMENWGIVTYAEDALIEWRDVEGEILNKVGIVEIIAHEFAHMWFGDEVTPVWWEYLWLSEGFATYFHYFAPSLLEPSWMTMHQFVASSVHSALYEDSLSNTRPMNIPGLGSPQSIQGIFNFIPYAKSASVIRMMSHVLGEDVFQRSLQRYISNMSRRTTMPEYLYEAMQEAVDDKEGSNSNLPEGVSVADVMGSWAGQAGYPLITVAREGDSHYFNITQHRFFRTPPTAAEVSGTDELWWVPLSWATPASPDYSDTSPRTMMPPTPQLTLQIPDSLPYIVFNIQQSGYYRIMYDTQNWEALSQVLSDNPNEIHVLNRGQIIDDIMEFCEIGLMPCDFAMNLLQYLSDETELHPWRVAERRFNRLFVLMRDSPQYYLLQKMVLRLNNKRLGALGSDNIMQKDSMVRVNRENSIALACSAASEECLQRGNHYVRNIREASSAHIRGVELCAALRGLADEEVSQVWSELWQEFLTSPRTSVSRRMEIRKALPCISDEVTLNMFMERVLSAEDNIEHHEVMSLLQDLISSSSKGGRTILYFLEAHFTLLKQRCRRERNGLANIIRTLGEYITTQEDSTKLYELSIKWREAEAEEDPGTGSGSGVSAAEREALLAALEAAQSNIRWQGDQRLQIEHWLTTRHNM